MTDNIKPTFLDASIQPDGKTTDWRTAKEFVDTIKDAGYKNLSW